MLLAIDAGGTHTRVLVLRTDGTVLGAGRAGGGSPNHSHDAQAQVEAAVAAALNDAAVRPEQIALVGGGFAGINRSTGQDWTRDWFSHVNGPRILVNDAVTAHAGAFLGAPGVIVIAGTGSTIVTLGPDGEPIDSGMFEHYAGGARHLVFDVVRRLLIGEGERDDPIVPELLKHWQVSDVDAFRTALRLTHQEDRQEVKRRHGAFAPAVTRLADVSGLADAALTWLCDLTAVGVRLLLPVAARPVDHPSRAAAPVARIGALAESEAYGRRLARALTGHTEIVDSPLGSVGGAAAFTLRAAGISVDTSVLESLRMGIRRSLSRLS